MSHQDSWELRALEAQRTAETFAERLHKLDLEEAQRKAAEAKPPVVNYLAIAQRRYDDNFADAEWVEACRASAWVASGLRILNAPSDGSWPPGMSAEIFCRREFGLSDDGQSLVKPPEANETATPYIPSSFETRLTDMTRRYTSASPASPPTVPTEFVTEGDE